jgi:hypothetical protein
VDAILRLIGPLSRDDARRWVDDVCGGVRVQPSWIPNQEFRLLPYRPSEETPGEWEERNVAALRKLCREQVRLYGLFSDALESSDPKPRRGPGEKGRNTPLDRRYEWAFLRLAGWSWKKIARAYNPTPQSEALASCMDTIRKSVIAIFEKAMIEVPPHRK